MGTLWSVDGITGVVSFNQKGTSQLVLENGTSFPGSPAASQVFYRTDQTQLYVYDGTTWRAINGAGKRVYNEVPSGTINGVNAVFTVANIFVAGTTTVTRDGLIMQGGGVDYTETPSTATITFTTAPASGSSLLVSYSISESNALPSLNRITYVTGTPSGSYSGSTTVFALPWTYAQNTGSLLVWSSGVLMGSGASADYQETSNTSITFNTARPSGEIIQFVKIGVANDIATSSVIQVADGTALAPSLSFQTDTNMGLYKVGSDTLGFATGGVNALSIDASQNLNIVGRVAGSNSVNGNYTALAITNTNATSGQNRFGRINISGDNGSTDMGLTSGKDTSNTQIGTISTTGKLVLASSATTALTLDTSQNAIFSANVGIGNTTPGQKLVIAGGTNGRARLKVTSGVSNFGKFEFSTDDSSTASTVQIAEITANITHVSTLQSNLVFATNSGDSLTTALTLDASQNATFAGTVTVNTTAVGGLVVQGSINSSTPRIYAKNTNATSGQTRTALLVASGDNGNVEATLQAGKDSSNNEISMVSGQSYLQLGFGGVEYARITTNGLQFQSTKGIYGTTTNDNATAGNVGQYIESVVSAVTLPASSTYGDITSISLTAGDWDVTACNYTNAGTATGSGMGIIGISTLSGSNGGGLTNGSNLQYFIPPTAALSVTSCNIPSYRISLASTTTIYMKFYMVYSGTAPTGGGRLSARRVR